MNIENISQKELVQFIKESIDSIHGSVSISVEYIYLQKHSYLNIHLNTQKIICNIACYYNNMTPFMYIYNDKHDSLLTILHRLNSIDFNSILSVIEDRYDESIENITNGNIHYL